YRTPLSTSIDVIRLLLCQGLPFCGHDESEVSKNQGNFLEFFKFLVDHNESVLLKNAPDNLKLTSHAIQKDIVSVIASELRETIRSNIGDGLFSILIDEPQDVSVKEQMVVLRYVDKMGYVIDFFAIVHVIDTIALSLKAVIDKLFSTHELRISRIRGLGYDGANNFLSEFNVLKSLIIRENQSGFYVQFFAHQLQLTLVAVAKIDCKIVLLFKLVATLSIVVEVSCKRRDCLREKKARLAIALGNGEITSGRGLNQETSTQKVGDTRWGSHYGAL
ncbi:LOW QUALITY PROTEIN: DUF4371 domain-containing protein, partial [Cephalotus follicularis]